MDDVAAVVSQVAQTQGLGIYTDILGTGFQCVFHHLPSSPFIMMLYESMDLCSGVRSFICEAVSVTTGFLFGWFSILSATLAAISRITLALYTLDSANISSRVCAVVLS